MRQEETQEKQAPDINRCSFCGLPQDQVERLIGGPHGVFICNECIELCNLVIREDGERKKQGE